MYKKKTAIISSFIAIILVASLFLFQQKTEYVYSSPKPGKTIVIDAGHGGIDGGSIGYSGTKESDLNLVYSKKLENYLNKAGFNVVQTRTTKDGLYPTGTKNYKKDDMKKRKETIEKSNADLVISIHMNSFPTASSKGAQVFFCKGNTGGQKLANSIQRQFISTIKNARKNASTGDYYMVTCTDLPAVIVECGFLSNPEEEKLLLDNEYQNKLCYAILCGVLDFFSISY